MILLARERVFLINLRDAFLLSKSNGARLSSRTVLFISAPKDALHESHIHRIFGDKVKNTWAVTDLDELEDLVGKRNDTAMELEEKEVLLARNVNSRRLKAMKKGASSNTSGDYQLQDVVKNKRPTHRPAALLGEKVDTIEWLRKQLSDTSHEVSAARESQNHEKLTHYHAVFVEYETQLDAQKAYQTVQYHLPLHLEERYIGVQPKELLWNNLRVHMAERIFRDYIATALVFAIIVFWSIPVGIVGTLSNINYLTDKVKFLGFIKNLPNPVLGLITGPLPPFLMSLFVSYVPTFFRCEYSTKAIVAFSDNRYRHCEALW
jgi:calcium permeable stress-gated cation channel